MKNMALRAPSAPFAGLDATGLDRADLPRILRELPFGVAVLDSARRTLFLNSALERLTGYASAEVAGVPCRHVLRGSFCLMLRAYFLPPFLPSFRRFYFLPNRLLPKPSIFLSGSVCYFVCWHFVNIHIKNIYLLRGCCLAYWR